MEELLEVVVVGGGVVGAAVLQALSTKLDPVWLLEKRPRLGGDVTERNSGVIHAGLYYPADSLKTRLCVEGNRMLEHWTLRHAIPHRRCGKLVVAVNDADVELVEELFRHAVLHGVGGFVMLSQRTLEKFEPQARGVTALWSPHTGIVDARALTYSLATDACSKGAQVLTSCEVTSLERLASAWRVDTTRGAVHARVVINAAGLYADDLARLAGVSHYQVHPCRGDYFRWQPRTTPRIARLIYPVTQPGAPGLGVHLTLDLGGALRFGPDAFYVDSKSDYSPPSESKRHAFAEAAGRYILGVHAEDLVPDYCGIRPKLRAPTEREDKDFVIREDLPGLINLIGIESPGLTASLAIGRHVATMLGVGDGCLTT